MCCVFHHVSGHLPRQIWFWTISTKTWASVRPLRPLLGQMPSFFRKWILMAPLMQVQILYRKPSVHNPIMSLLTGLIWTWSLYQRKETGRKRQICFPFCCYLCQDNKQQYKNIIHSIKVKKRSYISEEDESSSAGEGEEIVTKVSHRLIIWKLFLTKHLQGQPARRCKSYVANILSLGEDTLSQVAWPPHT